MFKLGKFRPVYRGSVKILRAKKQPTVNKTGVFLFEFTDDYSIFDYGKMPDTIPGKGAAMAMGSAFFFEKIRSPKGWKDLADSRVWKKIRSARVRRQLRDSKLFRSLMRKGLPTHYRGLVDPQTGETVSLAKLRRPSNLLEVDSVRILHPAPLLFSGKRIWNYNGFASSNGEMCHLVLLYRIVLTHNHMADPVSPFLQPAACSLQPT